MKTGAKLKTLALMLVIQGACEDLPPPAKPTPVARPAAVAEPAAPAPVAPPPAQVKPPPSKPSVGMKDPFTVMDRDARRTFDNARRAARKGKLTEARAALQALVAANPDNTQARFEELRVAARAGDLAAIPDLWRELLARDFVRYVSRINEPLIAEPLRASSHWAEIQSITAEARAHFAGGLHTGLVFVARTYTPAAPKFADDVEETTLAMDQEVYHFDLGTGRYRRLTETGGRVLAIHREPGRSSLLLLTAGKLTSEKLFGDIKASVLSLDTMDTTGPFPLKDKAALASLCFSPAGEPTFAVQPPVGEARSFTLDVTGSALVAAEGCAATVATTMVEPAGTRHRRPLPEGVQLSGDGKQLTGVMESKPIRTSQAIRPESTSWSPGKKRLVFTGALDRCEGLTGGEPGQDNSLLVWSADGQKAERLVTSRAAYETTWLDDERLVYESGLGRGAKLTVYDFGRGEGLVVPAPAGAALFGLPTLACPSSETHAMVR